MPRPEDAMRARANRLRERAARLREIAGLGRSAISSHIVEIAEECEERAEALEHPRKTVATTE